MLNTSLYDRTDTSPGCRLAGWKNGPFLESADTAARFGYTKTRFNADRPRNVSCVDRCHLFRGIDSVWIDRWKAQGNRRPHVGQREHWRNQRRKIAWEAILLARLHPRFTEKPRADVDRNEAGGA